MVPAPFRSLGRASPPGTGFCDYLLVDDAPRRPFRSAEDILGDRLATIAELTPTDRDLVLTFIDALVTKTRLKHLAADAS